MLLPFWRCRLLRTSEPVHVLLLGYAAQVLQAIALGVQGREALGESRRGHRDALTRLNAEGKARSLSSYIDDSLKMTSPNFPVLLLYMMVRARPACPSLMKIM